MEDYKKRISKMGLFGCSIYYLFKYLKVGKKINREYQPSYDYNYERATYTNSTKSSSSTSSHISDHRNLTWLDNNKEEQSPKTLNYNAHSDNIDKLPTSSAQTHIDCNTKEKQSPKTLNYNAYSDNVTKLSTSSAQPHIDCNTKEKPNPKTLNYNAHSDNVAKLSTSSAQPHIDSNTKEKQSSNLLNYNTVVVISYSRNDIKEHDFNILLENTSSFQYAISNWNKSDILEHTLNIINCNSVEYQNVITPFKKSCKNFNVVSLSRVQNIYLLSRYLLKKEELTSRYKEAFNERVLYHGTKSTSINNILNDNFDWRLHGTNVGHRFGQGVSFSPNARYSIEYCDSFKKGKIIVCNVLMGPVCNGFPETVLPPVYKELKNSAPIYYNATVKPKKKDVIVKYSDDEFYPAYVIEFSYNKSKNKNKSVTTNR